MRRRFLNLVVGLLLSATPVVAQTYEAPDNKNPAEKSVAKEWGIGAVFLIGCLAVAFKPSKRAPLR